VYAPVFFHQGPAIFEHAEGDPTTAQLRVESELYHISLIYCRRVPPTINAKMALAVTLSFDHTLDASSKDFQVVRVQLQESTWSPL
jgi:hypothetical protein